MTKLQLIEKEWGYVWDTVKDFVDKDGFVKQNEPINLAILRLDPVECEIDSKRGFRPKKLTGIDYNNGWTKIDEYGLPKEEGKYVCWSIYGRKVDAEYFIFKEKQSRENNEMFWRSHYTHYRLPDEIKPPLY